MSKGKSAKLEDIARSTGNSLATVSRALSLDKNKWSKVSEERREAIRAYARKVGYPIPNHLSNVIGFITPSISDPFWTRVYEGIDDVARRSNRTILLTISHNDPDHEAIAIDKLKEQSVDGIIISASREKRDHIKKLESGDIVVVEINRQSSIEADNIISVDVDDREGAKRAVQELYLLGHRKIGYLGLIARPLSNENRKQGYKDALEEKGIEPSDEWIVESDSLGGDMKEAVRFGRNHINILLDSGVTAVLCYNDMTAIGALQGVYKAGKSVPKDVSIMGFDDIDAAWFVTPRLSTMRQPRYAQGQVAMACLLRKIDPDNETIQSLCDEVIQQVFMDNQINYNKEKNLFRATYRPRDTTRRI